MAGYSSGIGFGVVRVRGGDKETGSPVTTRFREPFGRARGRFSSSLALGTGLVGGGEVTTGIITAVVIFLGRPLPRVGASSLASIWSCPAPAGGWVYAVHPRWSGVAVFVVSWVRYPRALFRRSMALNAQRRPGLLYLHPGPLANMYSTLSSLKSRKDLHTYSLRGRGQHSIHFPDSVSDLERGFPPFSVVYPGVSFLFVSRTMTCVIT